MKVLKQTYHIQAPIEKVWQALVDPKVIELWSGTEAVMSDIPNSSFKLWGGDIHGVNTEVIPNLMLSQDWYGGEWSKPSKVVITLVAKNKGTMVNLKHWDIPEGEEKDFDEGWKDFYFGPIKELLESS